MKMTMMITVSSGWAGVKIFFKDVVLRVDEELSTAWRRTAWRRWWR